MEVGGGAGGGEKKKGRGGGRIGKIRGDQER